MAPQAVLVPGRFSAVLRFELGRRQDLLTLVVLNHICDFRIHPSEKPVHPLMLVLSGAIVPIRKRRPDVPKGLATANMRAVSHDPAARFRDAALFREALEPYGR